MYINLGEVAGQWQGFRYEMDRIPFLGPPAFPNAQPRFCGVAVGDVTGDGYVDLHFADYDSSGSGGASEPPEHDYNNKLLINQGAANPGYFTDSLTTRMSANPGLLTAMGMTGAIADMNNDGFLDVVKLTALNPPQHIAIQHNDPNNPGFFPDPLYKPVYQSAGYGVSAGELNNDGRVDLVVTDDNADRFLLNTGNAANGTVTFTAHPFSFQTGGDDGFGGESRIADLNNDGYNDVLISDADEDIGGCTRRTHIYRNLGNAPNVTLQEQQPPVIPNNQLTGTHDLAVFDIDNDGWKDIVIGRCGGTQVWMNVPPTGLAFSYPGGLPAHFPPDQPFNFQVQLSALGSGVVMADSARIFISLDDGPYLPYDMTPLGDDLYEATLPSMACAERVDFYFSGQLASGQTFTDPPNAPGDHYSATAAVGAEVTLLDEIEGPTDAWTIVNGGGLTAGGWEPADPNGTINAGVLAAPEDDATGGAGNVKAFITQNAAPGEAPGAADVDGGATHLLSPIIDLAGADATISFSAWFYSSIAGTDALAVEVSNDAGQSWSAVQSISGTSDQSGTVWQTHGFVVSDFVPPTSTVRVRFTATDGGAPSIVEAGIDDFRVEEFLCVMSCAADIAPVGGDGTVGIDDLFLVIAEFGNAGGPGDIAGGEGGGGDGIVDIDDLFAVIAAWGECL